MSSCSLHTLVTTVTAPTVALSASDGEMVPGGTHGIVHADVRVLCGNRVLINGHDPEPLTRHQDGPTSVFLYFLESEGVPRYHGEPGTCVERRRDIRAGEATEEFIIHNCQVEAHHIQLRVFLGSDFSGVEALKSGAHRPLAPYPAVDGTDTITFGDGIACRLTAPGATLSNEGDELGLTWEWDLEPGGQASAGWRLEIADGEGAVIPYVGEPFPVDELAERLVRDASSPWGLVLDTWIHQSLRDLESLRMATTGSPGDPFFAAGAPWFLTLFGRDSLWSARFLVNQDWRPAASTLRTLAALQGKADNPASAEAPGKIMHELRRGTFVIGSLRLPPLYYGSIDATALWICLLHDAWRAGMPEDEVRALLPNLRAALAWVTGPADVDGDGFAEYQDHTGHGLTNQGWKDSPEAIRFADGRLAPTPLALVEVQAYAHEAAAHAADLLEALGETGADELRAWAGSLRERFRAAYWCGSGADRYPALALDADKNRVDSVGSNMGHLLGTGLLDAEEEALIARRLVAPDLNSGLGLRTLSTTSAAYAPLSYHCGAVWPHDTAIAIRGLLRAGFPEEARELAQGLMYAARAFDGRLPELYSGDTRPIPYPAACRPQAWAAAAAVVAAEALGANPGHEPC